MVDILVRRASWATCLAVLTFFCFSCTPPEEIWSDDSEGTGNPVTGDGKISVKNVTWLIDGHVYHDHAITANALYMVYYDSPSDLVWRTEGSPGTTQKMFSQNAGSADISVRFISTSPSDFLYFFITSSQMHGFWKTDGTPEGASKINDCFSLTQGLGNSKGEWIDNQLFFPCECYSSHTGSELCRSDGTPEGTYLVKEINKLSSDEMANSGYWRKGVVYNNIFLFPADDGEYTGMELWRSDGTADGTYQLRDIYSDGDTPNGSSSPSNFVLFKDLVYFWAEVYNLGEVLMRTDGTEVGTIMVKDIDLSAHNLIVTDNYMFFYGTRYNAGSDGETTVNELWRSDGTEAGTVLVKSFVPIENGSLQNLTPAGDKVFFSVGETEYGKELWVSDGTEQGTHLVKDIMPGSESAYPGEFVVVRNKLYFTARTPYQEHYRDNAFWRSDGTEEGTYSIGADEFLSVNPCCEGDIFAYKDEIYFYGSVREGEKNVRGIFKYTPPD